MPALHSASKSCRAALPRGLLRTPPRLHAGLHPAPHASYLRSPVKRLASVQSRGITRLAAAPAPAACRSQLLRSAVVSASSQQPAGPGGALAGALWLASPAVHTPHS
ncbi:hypothetical protein ABPG75_000104 [Micractinium tetrahymenae]